MKRAVALIITVVLLALLFWKVDQPRLWENLRNTQWNWFALALLMFVPQIGTIALRWKRLVSNFAPISIAESVWLILASQTMNLVLPSKMGDLSKGYFLSRKGSLELAPAMSIVVFEKMLDAATLAAFMLVGVAALTFSADATSLQSRAAVLAGIAGTIAVGAVLILYFLPTRYIPGLAQLLKWLRGKVRLQKVYRLFASSHDVIAMLQSRGAKRSQILVLSVVIWIFHLVQIYFFFRALGAQPALGQFATLVPLAIFVGLLPISIAGFGTRDTALIVLFPQFSSSVMLGVAMFVNLRYLLPAAAGIPFLHKYLQLSRPQAAQPETANPH